MHQVCQNWITKNHFNYYNVSPTVNGSSTVNNISFFGSLLRWNTSISRINSTNMDYNINGTGDYYLGRSYIIGVD